MNTKINTQTTQFLQAIYAFEMQRYDQAEALYLEVLCNPETDIAEKRSARMGLGAIYCARQQFDPAEHQYLILLHDAFQRGDRPAERLALHHLGRVAWLTGDLEAAQHYFDAEAILIEQLQQHL